MKYITLLVLLAIQQTILYAQVSKNFEGIEFIEWRTEFTEYKAIVIFDKKPEDDPYKRAQATVRVLFKDLNKNGWDGSIHSGLYEYNALLGRKAKADGSLEVSIAPHKFVFNRHHNPDKIIKGDKPSESLLHIELLFDKDVEFLSGNASYSHYYKPLNVQVTSLYSADEMITLIKQFYTDKDELYSELILHAAYLEYLMNEQNK